MIFRPANGGEDGMAARYQMERQHHHLLGAVLKSYMKSGFCEAK